MSVSSLMLVFFKTDFGFSLTISPGLTWPLTLCKMAYSLVNFLISIKSGPYHAHTLFVCSPLWKTLSSWLGFAHDHSVSPRASPGAITLTVTFLKVSVRRFWRPSILCWSSSAKTRLTSTSVSLAEASKTVFPSGTALVDHDMSINAGQRKKGERGRPNTPIEKYMAFLEFYTQQYSQNGFDWELLRRQTSCTSVYPYFRRPHPPANE